jgi:hypothetical protein
MTSSRPTTISSWTQPWSCSWSGVAVGPSAWAIDTQLNYALVDWACEKGSNPIPAIAALLALVSLVSAVSSLMAWHRHEGAGTIVSQHDGSPRRLLAGIGVAAGVLFAIAIALQGTAGLLLGPCLR